MKVAITGNIGSGKSYVCALFRHLGIPVFDSDYEAKQLYDRSEVKERITARYGEEVYREDGHLNRRRLADRLFSHPEELAFVEGLLYPILNDYFNEWAEEQETPYVLYESALIFEKGLEEMFDAIVVVTASEATRIRRVMFRDHCTEEQVRARMALQLPESEKAARADYLITHDWDEEDEHLMRQILDIHEALCED